MIVFVCEKCKYTDLFEDGRTASCPRCNGNMVSLGITSAQWNRLGAEEIYELIHGKCDEVQIPVMDERPEEKEAPKEVKPTQKAGREEVARISESAKKNRLKDTQRIVPERKVLTAGRTKKKRPVKPGLIFSLVMIICIALALITQYREKIRHTDEEPFVQDEGPVVAESPQQTENDGFENCLYYDSIKEGEKEIYRIYYDLVMHKDEKGSSRTVTLDKFEYETDNNIFFNVYYAMLSDHPEFFYLQSAETRKLEITTVQMGSLYTVTFALGAGEPDENEKIIRFERATDDFMHDIDLSVTEPEIELQIHDKLIDMVAYDYDLLSRDDDNGDLGYTAYGALVEDSYGLKNRAVCGGYAQAFQYLLQKAGIEAAYVSGYADSESGTLSEQGSHAWNIVKLDGEWYEVDSCWDDIDPPPDDPNRDFYKFIKYEQPQYFNATHHWYNRTTEEMKYLPAGMNTSIRVQQGSEIYELSPCSGSTHVRRKDRTDKGYDAFVYLNGYLPQATGTKHALP